MRIRVLAILVAVLVGISTGVFAQTPPTVLYRLQPGSTYEEGCYGECLCPILQTPLEGTFGLTLLPTAGPFDVYAVENVELVVQALDKSLVGSGFYTPIGELNELQLELQTADGTVQQFSSGGLVPKGAEFPDIDIVVSVNQMMSCFDYVLHIVASPDTSSYPGPTLGVTRTELSWSGAPGSASYDVVCGTLEPLQSSGEFVGAVDLCVCDDHAATSIGFDSTPDAGQALWFLVRDGEGSYDSDGESQAAPRDAGIDASPLACP